MNSTVQVPPGEPSLTWFRAWYATADFPEAGRISYIAGALFVDTDPEPIRSHVAPKTDLTGQLARLTDELDRGIYLGDGARVVNEAADFSVEPDGCYLSWESFRTGRYRLEPTPDGEDYSEIVGTPDMVLEGVSPSSVHKDRLLLTDLYRIAGVSEYWLIDVRCDRLEFDVNRLTPNGYVSIRTNDGWAPSAVFGREFRLDRSPDPIGIWQYTLHVRPLS